MEYLCTFATLSAMLTECVQPWVLGHAHRMRSCITLSFPFPCLQCTHCRPISHNISFGRAVQNDLVLFNTVLFMNILAFILMHLSALLQMWKNFVCAQRQRQTTLYKQFSWLALDWGMDTHIHTNTHTQNHTHTHTHKSHPQTQIYINLHTLTVCHTFVFTHSHTHTYKHTKLDRKSVV